MGANYDFLTDQQTGVGQPSSADFVGSASDPGFFISFDAGEDGISLDDFMQFRLRLDAAGGNSTPSFDRNLWIGMDADLNGSIDVFFGVNRQGSANESAIYGPGTGANTSPSTTSIDNNPSATYALTSANYNYRPVNFGAGENQDGGTTNDLTPGKSVDPDYYVSFSIPLNDISSYLGNLSTPIPFDQNTPVQYVVATSTQSNSLNQDLGGIEGGVNSTTSWKRLGAFSPVVTGGGELVPEPSTCSLLAAFALFAILRRHRP